MWLGLGVAMAVVQASAAALIQLLAWKLAYAADAAQRNGGRDRQKEGGREGRKETKEKERKERSLSKDIIHSNLHHATQF